MANFRPMKQRFLLLLEENLRFFSIRGRFLDFGCGSGDVSEYLIDRCRMPAGTAYDPALTDAEIDRRQQDSPRGLVCSNTADPEDRFDLAVLFDVIEHVPDAPGVLGQLHRLVVDDGWLFITVPYNRHEWGIDDHFYGHLRRLSRRGVITLLENNGWDVLRTLDPTFPSFWLIRRVYLLVAGFSATARARHLSPAGDDLERSAASSKQSSWETLGPIPRLLSTLLVPWKLIRFFDLYFESVFLGFELFVVARRREGSRDCEVCANGAYHHHRFFDRTARQVCSYCRSELLMTGPPVARKTPVKRLSSFMRRLQGFLRIPRARRILKLAPPEASIIDIRSRDPDLRTRLQGLGWRVCGTVAPPESGPGAGDPPDEKTVVADLPDITAPAAYGMATLFHVVEHVGDLHAALANIDRLLLPGGYLILEYPNSRSLLKTLLGSRWFGYDPPHHRLLINPVYLADRLGLHSYRLVRESHLSLEYSYFIFAQSLANAVLPFHRDGLYRMLTSRSTSLLEKIGAIVSLPVFALAAAAFVVYQPLAALLKRGCVVQQIFQKTDVSDDVG